jgi:hypothetical protein
MANLAKRNIVWLTTLVMTRLKRMQYRPCVPGGFLPTWTSRPSATPTVKDR